VATGTQALARLRRLAASRGRQGPSADELAALAGKPADWPRSCFLICSTPRSGSSLLAGLLASGGGIGRAAEFFSRANEPAWASSDYAGFLSFTKRRHAVDGVFGAKVHRGQLDGLLAGIRSAATCPDRSDRKLLDEAFGALSYVWIRRLDVPAQAVSWLKAEQTGRWSSKSSNLTGREPTFDFDDLHGRVLLLREWDAAWRGWFAENGVTPFEVTYEGLVADMAGVTRGALEFIGVDVPAEAPVQPLIERVFDAVNEEWIARYAEVAAARGL
jgi:LPS sulfotransferase NodH